MRIKGVWELLKSAVTKWSNDNAARLGAALSYYTIFAIPPLFIIIIYIASLVLDPQTVRSGLFTEVGGLLPRGLKITRCTTSGFSSELRIMKS